MDPERYRRIGELYHAALARPAEERERFLADACRDDERLRDEVAALLAGHERAGEFLEPPAMGIAAHVAALQPSAAVGDRIGPYDVRALLGRGGMGEVYRAHDSRLGRDVALKVLPHYFALDAQRLARFEREARILASLNHPNIAALYGIEDWCGGQILVLELVEGDTLEQRLVSGRMALREAIRIATQIVAALDVAHEHGIVHRDLKPANIVIRPDDTVKVLDFGLATVRGGSGATAVSTLTDDHAIIGTTPYMSPEQTRGMAVDRRTDIWAFGCVLFEMLTGRRAFEGETRSDVVAAVIERAPDWHAVPGDAPPPMLRLLTHCLEKDPRLRLRDVGDARFDLADALAPPSKEVPSHSRRARWHWRLAGAAGALLAGAIIVWLLASAAANAPLPITRFSVAASTDPSAGRRSLAVSPDGSRLAYLSPRGLTVRSRDRLDGPETILAADLPQAPFFSPDGQWVGYTDEQGLYKVPASGGARVTIADVAEATLASWSPEGIVFGDVRGLFRVSPDGGTPAPLPMSPLAPTEQAGYPELLPGGRAVLFTVLPTRSITIGESGLIPGTRIEVLDLVSGTRKTIVHGAARGHYLPSGHLIYATTEGLYAAPFDLKRLEVSGQPVQIVSDISYGEFAVSNEGTLVYLTGAGDDLSTLVWVDRAGREQPLETPPRPYVYPRLSPDGTRVVLDVGGPPARNTWMWDLRRRSLERFSTDPTGNRIAIWSPDGKYIAFGSDRFGRTQLFLQRADRSREPERLLESDTLQMPISFAPGGRLLFSEDVPHRGRDIQLLSLDGSHHVVSLVHSPGRDATAEVSPDGRWLAYDSDESGQFEVYVRPFPDADRARWQISTDGGRQPLWSRDGRELFYRDFNGAVMSVPVTLTSTFSAGTGRKLLDGSAYLGAGRFMSGRTYDLSLDGRRFLMLKADRSGSRSLVIILNWTEELKKRIPRAS